jgi:Mn2+/Fe2+ NRAMP family transporter
VAAASVVLATALVFQFEPRLVKFLETRMPGSVPGDSMISAMAVINILKLVLLAVLAYLFVRALNSLIFGLAFRFRSGFEAPTLVRNIFSIVAFTILFFLIFSRIYPGVSLDQAYLFTVVAVVGTTIAPYMQVYVQSSVVEKGVTPEDYARTRIDVWVGTAFAILIVFFIVVSTAATLHTHGIHINSAADAARALRPLAGNYAEQLFAIGLFGASMLAAGVLPLATAYSVSEALGFEKGVSRSFREAPIFLGIFTFLVAVGAAIAVIPNLPLIRVLLVTQVINGLLLPVILFAILRLVNNRELMGEYVNGRLYNLGAWLTAIIVTLLSLLLILATVFPHLFRP